MFQYLERSLLAVDIGLGESCSTITGPKLQAIITTYGSDESQRPAITAQCMGKKARVAYDNSLSLDDNHVLAATRLADVLGWREQWAYGRLPLGDYAHVAVTGLQAYSTAPPPGASSPPEHWRGRGGGSLPTPRGR